MGSERTAAGREADARAAWRAVADLFLSSENHDRFHAAADAAGVAHPGALKLLLGLTTDEPPSMRELATFMNCDASWVTALVDALEEPGLAVRQVAAHDRRIKLVVLTAAGEAAKERALEVLATPPKAMAALTDTETRQLARIMQKLAGAAD